MSISKLPSGRWRAQVWSPAAGHNVSVSKVLGGPGTFATKAEAKRARELAREKVSDVRASIVTVGDWHATWIEDQLYARPKASTNKHNAERTRAFVRAHQQLQLTDVNDMIVARWLAGGQRNGQIPPLRAMFNDAASAKAGRLIASNPFAGLGVKRTKGNAEKQPPSQEMVASLILHAQSLSSPAFAAWLQVAAYTGMRPGELDGLLWCHVDLEGGRVNVIQQWNVAARAITTPKNGLQRKAILAPPAREALVGLQRDSEWVFTNTRGDHFTASSRAYHWKAIRAAAGYTDSLYLATRHYFGWYATNVLHLDSEHVAIALGHTDGGNLVRRLYGHREHDQALDKVAAAFANTGTVTPLRVVRKDVG